MVKLSHHPTAEQYKRLRERWDLEDAAEPLMPQFDATVTDDTVQLQILRKDKRAPEAAERESDRLLDQLIQESKTVREALAGIITTLNHKASKRVLSESLEKCMAKLDKRVDNIFKLVAALGVILGILVAIKGH